MMVLQDNNSIYKMHDTVVNNVWDSVFMENVIDF